MLRILAYIILTVAILINCRADLNAQFYNGSQQEFGKSRVQYRHFTWSYYKFDRFDVYFYTGGRQLAIYTANTTDQIIEETEEFFDYILEGKVQIIIYNKISDLKQSNIGFSDDADYNVGGVTRIVGSKIFVYFDGDHNKLEQQIKAGVADVLISQMMYGGNWKDRVKNSTLLTLPEWYIEGLISYYAIGWNEDIENRVKDGIISGRYEKFNRLLGTDAKYAGHSIWNFIVDRYGESLIPSILYMTKVSRNIESGMLFVLGSSLKGLTKDWLDYYHNKFYGIEKLKSIPNRKPLIKKSKSNRVYTQLKVSPDGKFAAFATNQIGKQKVWVYNIETGKRRKVLRKGFKTDRLNDYSYPLLAWHPNSEMLSIINEKKDQIGLTYYFAETKKKESRPIHNFQKILDFSYSEEGKHFVMSAVQEGESDIYVYNISKNNYEPVTSDIYDDFQPRFVNGDKNIVFVSNRTNDTLLPPANTLEEQPPIILSKNKDLFLLDYAEKSNVLKRITRTPTMDESSPVNYEKGYIGYLGDENGVRNRFLAHFDSVISHVDTTTHYRFVAKTVPITNYSRSIIEHDVNLKSGKSSEIIFNDGKYRLFVGDFSLNNLKVKGSELENDRYNRGTGELQKQGKLPANKNRIPIVQDTSQQQIVAIDLFDEEGSIDIDNYIFEVERARTNKLKKEKEQPVKETAVKSSSADTTQQASKLQGEDAKDPMKSDSIAEKPIRSALARTIYKLFIPKRQWNYNTAFSTDYFVSQLDNRYLNASYQKFTGGGAIYTNPGLNMLFKVGVSDLLENYRIVGGVRLSSSLNSNEYFLSFEDLKKRLDKQIVFHRQALLTFQTNGTGKKVHTHDIKYALKWPFNEVISTRVSAILRNDRIVTLSTDAQSLRVPNTFDTWGGLKWEFIFDNTIKRGLNLYNGTRYKLFAEWYKQVDKKETDLYVLGLDYRTYIRVNRDLIWANRFAASTSFGDQRLIYYMGGVDGWLKPQFDNTQTIANEDLYAYQTLATNMRGFPQNVRNGNSFALINSELRFPIFKYFVNRPMKSDFLKNFQIVGFGDIGTAWTGESPYSSDNSFNTDIIESGPITVRLIHQREPIIAGYGLGLRSRLWGYFIRLDWARGIEDGVHLPYIFYWSLSLDF